MNRNLPTVLKVRCHYCSRFRNHREVCALPGQVVMCWQCYEHHTKALAMLAGHVPVECGGCQRKLAELKAMDEQGNVPMYLHLKDGVYQVLCQTCSDGYAPKRRDLYGSTEWGRTNPLMR